LGDDLRRLSDEQGLRGVDHVVGGETVVKPAGVRADNFGDGGGEGDNVVADFGFDLVDALDGKQMRKLRLIHDHVASGLIVSSGRGVKGSPRTYRMAAVPTDTRGMVEVPTEGTNASL